MSYDLLGYNLISPGSYGSYGMGMNMMANSLYMMNFCNQLKNYYTGGAVGEAKGTEGTAAGSGTAGMSSADFQTAFQEAFRKALQETMGTTNGNAAAQTSSGTAHTSAKTTTNRTVTAQSAYQSMSGYCSHPSRIWTSSFAHR